MLAFNKLISGKLSLHIWYICFLVRIRKLALAWLLFRLVNGDIRQFMPLVPGVPIEVNPVGEPRPLFVAYLLVVLLALVGRA